MFSYMLAIVYVCQPGWITTLPQNAFGAREKVQEIASDLAFGEKQLEQFMIDRPDTAIIIKRNPMFKWMCVWQFAGGLSGDRMYWNNREPEYSSADHRPPLYGPAYVRVTKDEPAIDKCTMLLFELLNREVDDEYQALIESPADKRKSREEFAVRCVRA